jgi:hypothetical protein
MQKMHWCTARVNLAGQGYTVIWFDQTNMVSWPEIQVIMAVHGEENVFDIKPVAIGETSIGTEKERLQLKYKYAPVEHCFPGRNPRMETLMPAETDNLPRADEYGQIIEPRTLVSIISGGNGHPVEEPPAPTPIPPQPEPEDEDEEDAAVPEGPPPPAVFKPGKHLRPAKGA